MLASTLAKPIYDSLVQYGNIERLKEQVPQYKITVAPNFEFKKTDRLDDDGQPVLDDNGDVVRDPIPTELDDRDYGMTISYRTIKTEFIKFNQLRRFLNTIDEICHLPVLNSSWRGVELSSIQVYQYWKPLFQPRKVSLINVSQSSINVKDMKTIVAKFGRIEDREYEEIMMPEEFFAFMEFFNTFLKKKDVPKVSIIDAIGEVTVNDILSRISCDDDLNIMYDYKSIPVDIVVDPGFIDQYAFCATFDSDRFVLGLFI